MTNCFIFDINKCVGCHACLVACVNENGTLPPLNWREIHTYNIFQYPSIPVFYHSLACNHCDEPSCLKACPAKAFYRDPETHAIIHEPEKCLGCKYCTWACPYDAPKFNEETKLIEKCTFCNKRIEDGEKPACASLCPTGALGFEKRDKSNQNSTPGFPDKNIQPNIVFIPLREERRSPEIAVHQSKGMNTKERIAKAHGMPSKIDIKKEWVLVIFTLIVAFLTGNYAGSVVQVNSSINPYLFGSLGAIGMLLSAVHLGQKSRAYRSVLNLKSSWLSREIFFFTAFFIIGLVDLFQMWNTEILKYVALVLALVTVLSVDMIYKYTEYKKVLGLHSAMISITAVTIMTFYAGLDYVCLGFIFLKAFLYLGRKKITIAEVNYGNLIISLLRVIVGFLLPVYVYLNKDSSVSVILLFLAGEVFDRVEFYIRMDVITPQKQLIKQLISEF